MPKAVLAMDMPECCADCPCSFFEYGNELDNFGKLRFEGGYNMTDEEKRELYFANSVLRAIDHVQTPMLVYDEEKQVVKKALQMYSDMLRNTQNIIRR